MNPCDLAAASTRDRCSKTNQILSEKEGLGIYSENKLTQVPKEELTTVMHLKLYTSLCLHETSRPLPEPLRCSMVGWLVGSKAYYGPTLAF